MGNKRKDFRAALVDEYPGLPTLTTAKPACATTCAVDERLSVYFINRDCSAIADCRKWACAAGSSGNLLPPSCQGQKTTAMLSSSAGAFLPPSPPAEKTTARQDQARQSGTDVRKPWAMRGVVAVS
jgi:hypothetical protein